MGMNETESAGESDDKDEGHILADHARSGGAGKASKAALLSGGAGTSTAVNSRSSSGNKSKKRAKRGDAAVERESKAIEEEVDDEAQAKGPSKKPQGKQSARKSSGGNMMVPPARAQTEPVGGKAESKTSTSRSTANVPDAPKTTTKLHASASKTTASSVVTPTVEVRMPQDPIRGEEAKPAGVMDDGIADKVSGGTGAALPAKKGKARGKEITDKGDGLPKEVERAESVKSKEDGGKGNGTTKGGGNRKHKDKSKHSTKGKGEEVQESTNDEFVEKRRRAGEDKAERGRTAKEKSKGTGKGGHAKAKADSDEKRLLAEPSDPSSAKAPQDKRGKGGDCGARPEKHKGAGKEEGASKGSSVDKRGDKHKSTRKDAGKGAGREEATVENRLEEQNDAVNDTDGGSTGQPAAAEKGDPSETSGVGGINRGKAKGKGKERRSTGVEAAGSNRNKDTAATHKPKEKRKDAAKAKVSEKKSKVTLERSGSTAKEAAAKERLSSKKSKMVDTNSKGKGKRDKDKEKKSVGKQATSDAPSTGASAVEVGLAVVGRCRHKSRVYMDCDRRAGEVVPVPSDTYSSGAWNIVTQDSGYICCKLSPRAILPQLLLRRLFHWTH